MYSKITVCVILSVCLTVSTYGFSLNQVNEASPTDLLSGNTTASPEVPTTGQPSGNATVAPEVPTTDVPSGNVTVGPETQSTPVPGNHTVAPETPSTPASGNHTVAPEKSTTPAAPATTTEKPDCSKNQYDDKTCDTYKQYHFCTDFMKECAKTCNPQCQSPVTTTPGIPPTTTTDYKCADATRQCCDKLIDCAGLTDNGNNCDSISGLYYPYCQYTCGACEGKYNCSDSWPIARCITLKLNNMCDLQVAKEYCWQTCTTCSLNP